MKNRTGNPILHKNHRGFSIVEIVVVIAVSSILLTAVVLICTSVSQYTGGAKLSTRRTDELTEVKNIITDWFEAFDHFDGYKPTISTDENNRYDIFNYSKLIENTDSETCTLYFYDNTLSYINPTDDRIKTHETEFITKIEFNKLSADADCKLFKCTITYTIIGEEKQSTFLLLRRSEIPAQPQGA